ncbi:MAG: hypothetical protein QNL62_06825 [Gammaproteobacteria bacterium]|nr:hypothetical protein [Gammaproteobacteria bacterium]
MSTNKYVTKDAKDAAIAKRFVIDVNTLIQPMGMSAKWRKARTAAAHEDTEVSVGNCQVILVINNDSLIINMTIYKRGFAWLNIYVHEGSNHELVLMANDVLAQAGYKIKYSDARKAVAIDECTPIKTAAILEALYLFLPG